MEWLQIEWVQWALGLAAGAITLWIIPNAWFAKAMLFLASKLSPVMTKIANTGDAAGTMAEGAGLEKVGLALHEGSDVVDEAEDIPRLLAEFTKDGDLTADEIKKLFAEVGEVGVEFKDFILKVFKKSE